ncbi:MAG: Sugar transferase [Candidatus Kaiserbacteria bacterium GW2011_GWC2_52_8b]|uniref:Sugar transferase n=1 Tax=Candidatus Kaiserbacteria bacterium GW2011_GWC2_52_8b TaxID=1618676 RepID=A0A0G1XLP3_9BACT|nr:MAG: Sugar transferase [candidate division Kazan bacterium GW2011_GWC1_52_13]KKW31790.1 MAG: Sugar transferase [Candidatus Kaiserbacteria bacterium GW2011_GWC2_52_8b]
MNGHNKIKTAVLIIGDYVVLYGALLVTLFLRYSQSTDPAPIPQHFIPFALIFVFWLITLGSFGLYDLAFMKNSRRFLLRLLRVMGVNFVLAILFFYLLPFFEIEPRRNLFLITTAGTIFIFAWRFLFNLFVTRAGVSRVIFLGLNQEILFLADFLAKNPQLGQKPAAFVSVDGENASPLPLPTRSESSTIPRVALSNNLTSIIKNYSADTIIITREIKENRTFVKMLFEVIPLGVSIVEFTSFHEALTGKIPMSLIEELWFLENLVGSRRRMYEFFKRMLDIALSIAIGAPALFLSLPIAAAIKLDSKGPILFRQKRVGRDGKTFQLIKFRSMVENAEAIAGEKGGGPDARHTRVGAFLRKNYLDELPQIINILRGEMSFIGPRPERPEYVEHLKKKIAFYEMRLLVAPGITGWAQIHMENDASVEDAPEKMQYDLYYVKNRALTLDLLIALKTAFTLFQRQGR